MYRQSDDLRFVKNRAALQRAFIDLTLEKRSTRITVKELAERAGVNRMTFYSHYDEVTDVLAEFLDGLAAEIVSPWEAGEGEGEPARIDGRAGVSESVGEGVHDAEGEPLGIGEILQRAADAMQHEMDFYRLVAQDARFEHYRAQFREAFSAIFAKQLEGAGPKSAQQTLTADMLASAITYAYLDWLAGRYGGMPLDELIPLCEDFASRLVSLEKHD